jgi:catechol 2,3-dioxygenase-like lactoylglutathione lyase family enzyme
MQNIASKRTGYNVSFVTIIVSDMGRSIEFYTQRLGLTLKTRYGDEFAIVEAPGVTIGLHPSKQGGAKPGSVSIGLGVDDVEEGRKRLEDRGVAFAGSVVDDPPMRFAFLKDPDGVELYLAEQSEWT